MSVKHELHEYMRTIPTIDAHEHLMPEKKRLAWEKIDALFLFGLYPYFACRPAGLDPELCPKGGDSYMMNMAIPLEERWAKIWPIMQRLKYTSLWRPPIIALRDIYGVDELNDDNYIAVSEKINAANQPGLYNAVLRDRCNITKCIVNNTTTLEDPDPPELMTFIEGVIPPVLPTKAFVDELCEKHNCESAPAYDDYMALVRAHFEDLRKKGMIGFKGFAHSFPEPDKKVAAEDYKKMLAGEKASKMLVSMLIYDVFELAAEWNLPVAIHCGQTNDWRELDPKFVVDWVLRHPNTRFDLFHLGMPFARDCFYVAKNWPNAYINLTWAPVISQEITRRSINEIIDTCGIHKVTAFGGDYVWCPECTYGHLEITRETLSEALEERINRGHLDRDGAEHIARLWFHDNPAALYHIDA